jgi:hypothetical protein
MTWAKYGTEYFDKLVAMLVDAGVAETLEDACVRTATEVHHKMFSRLGPREVQRDAINIPKRFLAQASSCPLRDDAAKELVRSGAWRDTGERYEIVHGRLDIKNGVMAQQKKLERDARSQRAARERKRKEAAQDVS